MRMGGVMNDDDKLTAQRVTFDLDLDSAAIVLVEHEGVDVLVSMPGGGLECYGQPVSYAELSEALRDWIGERRH